MTSPLLVLASAERDEHETPPWHPEHQGRLDAALSGVREAGLDEATTWRVPELADVDDLALVHDRDYLARLERFCASGGGNLDPDTVAAPGSWDTARRSAGAVIGAIDALRNDDADVAFAAGRPPGHHAVRDQAMGFCLFNSAAVGAARLAAAGERVAIVDWDVHHGNGTQDIFYEHPDVLYVSTHESPLYPGTGQLREIGAGAGVGTNVNLPFPAGTAGDTLRAAYDQVVIPTIERFAPDWLIISAGFDAHRNDPLAGMGLTAGDYADLARRLQSLVAPRRLLVVLEGGYDLRSLTRSVGATLSALVGGAYRPETASTGEIGMPTITAARQLWEI
ncbi:MAG: histone deacetylase [Ilumatobacter sp.]|nr:histone deacetylase [Ilumatobacter sp.]